MTPPILPTQASPDNVCFSCKQPNAAENVFCRACGSPLSLASYVDRQISVALTDKTRDRALVETESSIRIFERAYGWAKLVGGIATGLVALLVAGAAWESFKIRDTVNSTLIAVGSARISAERQINETASNTLIAMNQESSASAKSLRTSVKQANDSSAEAQRVVTAQRVELVGQANSMRKDFQTQAAAVTKDVVSARQQIQQASQLQPQMASLQQQLGSAQGQIQAQQKLLTSKADFVKAIFGSHVQTFFVKKTASSTSFAIIDGPKSPDNVDIVVLYVVLQSAPIPNTLELQFSQIPAPAGSFFAFHNILWAAIQKQSLESLLDKPVTISYFPDPDDTPHISSLSVKDGRVFADGEALYKFGSYDPDFKGSKLIPMITAVPPPAPAPTTPTKPLVVNH